MKKELKKSLAKSLPPLTIYLSDIEEMYSILNEKCDEVTMEYDKYEIQSINDIASIDLPHTNHFIIRGVRPFVSLECEKNSAYLYASENTAIYLELFHKIEDIVRKRKNLLRKGLQNSILSGSFFGLSFSHLILIYNYPKFSIGITLFILHITMAILWSFFGFIDHFQNYSIIIPKNKTEAPNIFERNKDQLFLLIFGAVIGMALTKLWGVFF